MVGVLLLSRLGCGLLVGLAFGLHGGVHLVNGRLQGARRILVGLRLAILNLADLVDGLLKAVTGRIVGHPPVGVAKQLRCFILLSV